MNTERNTVRTIIQCDGPGVLIIVRVATGAKEARVTKTGEDSYEVRVDAKAVSGRANKRLLEILSEHFGVPKSRISIVRGTKSRDKVVSLILENPT